MKKSIVISCIAPSFSAFMRWGGSLLFLTAASLAAAQSLPPGRDRAFACPSCVCLAATGEAILAAVERGDEAVAPPEQCLWAKHREDGHKGEMALGGSLRYFARMLTDDAARQACRRLWGRMVDHVRDSGRAYCDTDLADDAPDEARVTVAHCDDDDLMSYTALRGDALAAAAAEGADIDPASCPAAGQIPVEFVVIARLEAMAWLEEGRIVENLESHLRAEPGIGRAVARILRHGEVNRPQRKRALPVFEALVRKGLVEGTDVARLTDAMLRDEGQKQRYGSYFSCENGKLVPSPPLEDPEHVNELRRAIEFEQTIEEHIAGYGDHCKTQQAQGSEGG